MADIGNLRFGPEVGVGPPKADSPVLESWLENVRAIACDLEELRRLNSPRPRVHHAAVIDTSGCLANSRAGHQGLSFRYSLAGFLAARGIEYMPHPLRRRDLLIGGASILAAGALQGCAAGGPRTWGHAAAAERLGVIFP